MSEPNIAEIITEAASDVAEEMAAEQLMDENTEAEAENASEAEEKPEDADKGEANDNDEGRKAQYADALREMVQVAGFTREELEAMAKDETVHKDLADGKSLWAAAMSFRGRNEAQKSSARAKRAVPNVRKASAEKRNDEDDLSDKINKMSSKEFAEFTSRAETAAMSGKRVSIR